MNTVNQIVLDEFCEEFNLYLKGRFLYKKNFAYWNGSGNVGAKSKKFDLYLRLFVGEGYWPNNTLVIARIAFHSQRKGHGTDLLQYLNNYAIQSGYENIGIESVNVNSAAFGNRYGFSPWAGHNCVINCKFLTKNINGVFFNGSSEM
jgi:hypothetical protein